MGRRLLLLIGIADSAVWRFDLELSVGGSLSALRRSTVNQARSHNLFAPRLDLDVGAAAPLPAPRAPSGSSAQQGAPLLQRCAGCCAACAGSLPSRNSLSCCSSSMSRVEPGFICCICSSSSGETIGPCALN